MSNLITETGEALYGPRWQTDMADDLDVDDRTIRRWVAGTNEPRSGVYADLDEIILARIKRLRSISRRLKKRI